MSVYLPDSCLYLNLDTSTQVALRLHDAYSTAGCLEHTSGGEPAYACTHTHTHKHKELSLSCHITMEMAWGEVRTGALSFTNSLEGQSRGAPSFFHPQAISTPAELHSLSYLPLIWYFHKDDICIRQSRKCPGQGENSFLTGVTSNLHRPASDVLTIQLTITSHWVGAST